MREAIKEHLILLTEMLEEWKGTFDDYECDIDLPAMGLGFATFVFLATENNEDKELTGMAFGLRELAHRKEELNRKKWEEYHEWRKEESLDHTITPKEISKKLGLSESGVVGNRILEEFGYQIKDGKSWIPTKKALTKCTITSYPNDGKSNIQWNGEILGILREDLKEKSAQSTKNIPIVDF